jgi:phospholipid/cholesterol/gamma-HCH transport system permease protein
VTPEPCRLGARSLATLGRRRAGGAFAGRVVSHLFRPPFYPREFLRRCRSAGFSCRSSGLTAIFTGGALALQIYAGGARFNAEAVVPRSSPSAWCASWGRCWAG